MDDHAKTLAEGNRRRSSRRGGARMQDDVDHPVSPTRNSSSARSCAQAGRGSSIGEALRRHQGVSPVAGCSAISMRGSARIRDEAGTYAEWLATKGREGNSRSNARGHGPGEGESDRRIDGGCQETAWSGAREVAGHGPAQSLRPKRFPLPAGVPAIRVRPRDGPGETAKSRRWRGGPTRHRESARAKRGVAGPCNARTREDRNLDDGHHAAGEERQDARNQLGRRC